MSKGHNPRPYDKKAFDSNYDRIFPKKEEKKDKSTKPSKAKYPLAWLS